MESELLVKNYFTFSHKIVGHDYRKSQNLVLETPSCLLPALPKKGALRKILKIFNLRFNFNIRIMSFHRADKA
jgi:hypothetical protein